MNSTKSKNQLKDMTDSFKVIGKNNHPLQPNLVKQNPFYSPKRQFQALNEYYTLLDPKSQKCNQTSKELNLSNLKIDGSSAKKLFDLSQRSKQTNVQEMQLKITQLKSILNNSLQRSKQIGNLSISSRMNLSGKLQNTIANSSHDSQLNNLLSQNLNSLITCYTKTQSNEKEKIANPTFNQKLVHRYQAVDQTKLKLNLNTLVTKGVKGCLSERTINKEPIQIKQNQGKKELSLTDILKKESTPKSLKSIEFLKHHLTTRESQDHAKIVKMIFSYSIHKSLPCDAKQALQRYHSLLTKLEQKEICEFETVYFLGQKSNKLEQKELKDKLFNNGYDNEKGDYIFVLFDHIGYRYEMIEKLGKGSFGQAFKVYDHKRQHSLAMKVIKNKKRFHAQALIEITILKEIRDRCESIVKMKDYFMFRNHVCIVFELLSFNLYEFMKQNAFKGISLDLIRRFAIQLLQALLQMEKINIIHCDLKPENILLKESNKSGIKVIDFGSSCFKDSQLYTYIQSRFYRAPEIIMGLPYSFPIDCWSFGCIMVELFTGYPLFPSESEKDHMGQMIEVLGMPPQHMIENAEKNHLYFDGIQLQTQVMINQSGKVRGIQSMPIIHKLENCPYSFISFVNGFLQWDPQLRLTPAQGLVHPWILEGLPKQIRKQHLQGMKKHAPFLSLFNDPNHPDYDQGELSQGTQGETQRQRNKMN